MLLNCVALYREMFLFFPLTDTQIGLTQSTSAAEILRRPIYTVVIFTSVVAMYQMLPKEQKMHGGLAR